MYNLPYFKEKKSERLLAFMADHPFVILSGSNADGKPVATQVPVLLDEHNGRAVLSGHFMRNTDHHQAFSSNPNVLVLFTGPHCYVSASWYTNPATASTWNYMTVQVTGTMEFLGHEELLDILKRTTEKFEANNDSSASFEKLDPEYVDRLSKAIIGFRIHVNSLEHVFKLSQNRDSASYQEIINRLSAGTKDEQEIAEQMRLRQQELFG
ncbi:MAG TPA: FMN-binding negative transcriptional regulator [Flavitalea sp.]|nr:FMN-binding negative transcriptional regulator [Flavitalea sp.]